MKSFFEEHGKTLLVVIIVVALITLTSTIKADTIKEKVDSWVQTLSNSGNNSMMKLNSETPEEPETPEETIDVAKGDLITIDSKQYRVLDVNGTNVEVLAMYDVIAAFNSTSVTTSFNGTDGLKYEGSDIDKYLENTFYPSLSFKNAIVPQSITQDMYKYFDEPDNKNNTTYTYQFQCAWDDSDYDNANFEYSINVGSRHVYLLDIKDIFNYYDKRCITSAELNNMFWNIESSIDNSFPPYAVLYLRSASDGYSESVWEVSGGRGTLTFSGSCDIASYGVRPAFVIDLTKCEYTK